MRLKYRLSLGILWVLFALSAQAAESAWDKARVSYFGPSAITVYRSPNCGCCEKWIEHLEKHHFTVTDIPTDNIQRIKRRYGVPANLDSCHTAIINGYVIEGHVPASDIKRLLIQKPDIVGLTVPGMPVGPPGMAMGEQEEPFYVLQFNEKGEAKLFHAYRDY